MGIQKNLLLCAVCSCSTELTLSHTVCSRRNVRWAPCATSARPGCTTAARASPRTHTGTPLRLIFLFNRWSTFVPTSPSNPLLICGRDTLLQCDRGVWDHLHVLVLHEPFVRGRPVRAPGILPSEGLFWRIEKERQQSCLSTLVTKLRA